MATPTPNLDVKGSFTTQKHSRRAALGRQFRIQQRRRSRAAVRLANQRLQPWRGVDEHHEHASRRVRRLVVRQSRRHARLGQPAAPDRHLDGAPGRGRMSLWPSNTAQTVSVAGYRKFAAQDRSCTGFFSLRLVEQQRAARSRSRSIRRLRRLRCRAPTLMPKPTSSRPI